MDLITDQYHLMYGDCLDRMKEISNNAVNASLTDLPYGTTQCKWDVPIPFDQMWESLLRIVKPNSPMLFTAQSPFDKLLGCSNIEMLRYEWIWRKTAATGHLNAKKMPLKAHENVLVFYDKLPTYNPQKTQGHKAVNKFTKRHGDGECYGKTIEISGGGNTDRYPTSVLTFKSDKQKLKLHPTQKPLALMEYFIKTYTNKGDTVIDFTMGSGTTGVACLNAGRKFIGIESDLNNYCIAAERITTHETKRM